MATEDIPVTYFDCDHCGALQSVTCWSAETGLTCNVCGAEYGNPYAADMDIPFIPVMRRFVNGIQHPISCNCCGCVHGDEIVEHPVGCECFDCRVLLN